MRQLLISAPYVVTHDEELGLIRDGAVLVRGDRIAAVGPRAEIATGSGVVELAYPDGVVMPGLINAHTHLYSAFARGISIPGPPPRNFPEILERLWWRLDRTLRADDIYYSALLGVLDAPRWGVTTLIDHHASPYAVDGSLDLIARAFDEVGLRGILCYEVSDRDGLAIAERGRAENERFIRRVADEAHPRLRAAFGLHAAFTVGEETLARSVGAALGLGVGLHVHVAEDPCDVEHNRATYGEGPIERLARHGALGPKTIAAHCIHISEAELDALAASGTAVAHNPQSNMNNAVGVAPIREWVRRGLRCGIGSDGMTANIGEDFRTADLLHKCIAADPRVAWAEVPKMALEGNRAIADEYFGCGLGRLRPGAAADLTVKSYRPYTPLEAGNFWGHFLFGIYREPALLTVVDGAPVWREGRHAADLDLAAIDARANELAVDLWRRFGDAA